MKWVGAPSRGFLLTQGLCFLLLLSEQGCPLLHRSLKVPRPARGGLVCAGTEIPPSPESSVRLGLCWAPRLCSEQYPALSRGIRVSQRGPDLQTRWVSKFTTLLCGHYFLPIIIHLVLQPIFIRHQYMKDDGRDPKAGTLDVTQILLPL